MITSPFCSTIKLRWTSWAGQRLAELDGPDWLKDEGLADVSVSGPGEDLVGAGGGGIGEYCPQLPFQGFILVECCLKI